LLCRRTAASGGSLAPEANEDAVTLNLVNVPAPQPAKTVLSDMFGIKYHGRPDDRGKDHDPDVQPGLPIDDHRPVLDGSAGK
jgi:hypothetical protein